MSGMQQVTGHFSRLAGTIIDNIKNGDGVIMGGAETTDGRGNPVYTWTVARTAYDLPLVYGARTAKEVVIEGKAVSVTVYPVTLPAQYKNPAGLQVATVVFEKDHLVIRPMVVDGVQVTPQRELEIVAIANKNGVTIEVLCMEAV